MHDPAAGPRTGPTSTIVFDGSCRFCQRQIEFIRRSDPRQQFDYLPSQTTDLLERYPALAGEDFNSGLRIILPDGSVRVGADAVYEIARRLPYWRLGAWLYRLPGLHGLAQAVYRRIAARRHWLAGRCQTQECRVPRDIE